MLQMKCPECAAIIRSPFLIEIGSVTCDQCHEDVTVKDVFVTTRGFKMHRDDLLARVLHYRALLKDIEREKILIRNSSRSSTEAQKSLDQLYNTLQELLAAARENFRLQIAKDFPLDIELSGKTGKGRLLNLSTKGAAVKYLGLDKFPIQGSILKLLMTLPNIAEPVIMSARVAWIGKRHKDEQQDNVILGVKFVGLDEKTRDHLWDYISSTQ